MYDQLHATVILLSTKLIFLIMLITILSTDKHIIDVRNWRHKCYAYVWDSPYKTVCNQSMVLRVVPQSSFVLSRVVP